MTSGCRLWRRRLAAVVVAHAACCWTAAADDRPAAAPGRFVTLAKNASGWTFVKDGRPFLSLGATTVIPVDKTADGKPDRGHYDGPAQFGGDPVRWAQATGDRFRGWGCNTLGAWADPVAREQSGLCFAVMASFGGWSGNRLMDVFAPDYAAAIEQAAVEQVKPLADEPRLLGWFTNNELNWYGEFGWPENPDESLLDKYLALPVQAPGRAHLLRWLEQRFGAVARLRDAFQFDGDGWTDLAATFVLKPRRVRIAQETKAAWAGEVAERYFTLCEQAIRRHDRNHLVLGARFAGVPMLPVLQAQARHCDVMSLNCYQKDGAAPVAKFDELYALCGKPVLISEFGWRSTENRSGCPNGRGVDVTAPTQRERAARADRFMRGFLGRPYVVGMHWFQYHDEPAAGRFDGEDSSYGLVDHRDQPYAEVVAVLSKLGRSLDDGSFKRGPFPGPATRKGWPEYAPTPLTARPPAAGPFAAASLLPAGNQPGKWLAVTDNAHGATLSMQPSDHGWQADYDTGTGWGVVPNVMLAATPLAGARKLRLRVKAPADVVWKVLITETGAHDPAHRGTAGADGETFGHEALPGPGRFVDVVLPLEDFLVRWEYGNQHGNGRLDLDGLESVGIGISPAGRKGSLVVEALDFLP